MCTGFSGFAQDTTGKKRMDVIADAHGFMCPFLTPKLIRAIEQADSCKVWKTEDLVIHIEYTPKGKINKEIVLKLAENIGYERNKIHVREK